MGFVFAGAQAIQMGIGEAEIEKRKAMLGFTDADVAELKMFSGAATALADLVAQDFYRQQVVFPEIRKVLGDGETLSRLMSSMEKYVIQMFDGDYGMDYVNSRLKVGRVHARIGVPAQLYLSSMFRLKEIIGDNLMESGLIPAPPKSLEKIAMFDLQLVMDAYVHDRVNGIGPSRDAAIRAPGSAPSPFSQPDDMVLHKMLTRISSHQIA